MSDDVILRMSGVSKAFPGVKALKNVDFTLRKGEIHAIMGENGAGKSTLIKCLTGVYPMDEGSVVFDGKNISPKSPSEAMLLGISSVYQEVNLCPNLTVAENIFIGRQPMKGAFIDWKAMNALSEKALSKFNLKISVTRSLDSYSVAIQQMVAIARAVDISAKALILDEPTSSLDAGEVGRLFQVVRGLKDEGMGIVFITHFLDQVYELTDCVTVLRNGELVGEYPTAELTRIQLVTKMIGKDFDEMESLQRVPQAEEPKAVVEATDLCVAGELEDVSLTLCEREIVGFAGLLGSGRSETAGALFGLGRLSGGSVMLKGKVVNLQSPAAAIRHRIALCPEDRKRDGIVGELTVRENIALALQGRMGAFKFINRKRQYELADKYIKLLGIATPDADKKAGELSGGNQQKVILARWLATEPDVLILDEPTRGIDVGAKAEIMKLTLDLCRDGMAVAFISSELAEVVRLSNRVIVMRDRRKIAEIGGGDLDQASILNTIAGGDTA